MYIPTSCFEAFHLDMMKVTARGGDCTPALQQWYALPYSMRSWQPKLMTHLSIRVENGLDMRIDPARMRADLFYLTNRVNDVQCVDDVCSVSSVFTLWTLGTSEYDDWRCEPSLRRYLRMALNDTYIFYMDDFLALLDEKYYEVPLLFLWARHFIVGVKREVLRLENLLERMTFNSYTNTQTYGFRGMLNDMRLSGHGKLLIVDQLRKSSQLDLYSGHFIGMIMLLKDGVYWYDIRRWLMLVNTNIISTSQVDDDVVRNLRSHDQRPECRKGIERWHQYIEILNTIDLLLDARVIESHDAESLRDLTTQSRLELPNLLAVDQQPVVTV